MGADLMLKDAISSLKAGRFVVLYDGEKREGEADLVIRPCCAGLRSPELPMAMNPHFRFP